MTIPINYIDLKYSLMDMSFRKLTTIPSNDRINPRKEGFIMLKKIFIGIVILISIAIVSMPLYNLANGKKIGLLANHYTELPIELTKGEFYPLKIIDNSEAFDKVLPTNLCITNNNGFDKKYDLLLTINKESNIDYNNIVISLNTNIMYLSNVPMKYDEKYYYFTIDSKEAKAYSKNLDYFRIWLKKDSINLDKNSSLKINFIIK